MKAMYLKIYFDDKPLFLCDAIDGVIEPYIHHDDAVFIDELNSHTVKAMIHEMQQPKVHAGIFLHDDLSSLRKEFFKKFTVIQAAGGAVINGKDQLLMIFRRGKWDLPKGKLDKGESIEACALREVKEETGLSRISSSGLLTTTYHTYHEGTRFVLKESFWYRMTAENGQELIPQTEEDITEIEWVTPDELDSRLANTFPSIIDVVNLLDKP